MVTSFQVSGGTQKYQITDKNWENNFMRDAVTSLVERRCGRYFDQNAIDKMKSYLRQDGKFKAAAAININAAEIAKALEEGCLMNCRN